MTPLVERSPSCDTILACTGLQPPDEAGSSRYQDLSRTFSRDCLLGTTAMRWRRQTERSRRASSSVSTPRIDPCALRAIIDGQDSLNTTNASRTPELLHGTPEAYWRMYSLRQAPRSGGLPLTEVSASRCALRRSTSSRHSCDRWEVSRGAQITRNAQRVRTTPLVMPVRMPVIVARSHNAYCFTTLRALLFRGFAAVLVSDDGGIAARRVYLTPSSAKHDDHREQGQCGVCLTKHIKIPTMNVSQGRVM